MSGITKDENCLNFMYEKKIHEQKNIEDIIKLSRASFKSGRTRNYEFRLKQLKNLLRMCDENLKYFSQAIETDLQRPKMETTIFELNFIRNEISGLIGNFKKWSKPKNLNKPLLNIFDNIKIHYDPYGVVLIISTWNYPFQVSLIPLAGAIAGGNCVIIKLSENCTASSTLLIQLLPKYLDNDCYQIIIGDSEISTSLLQNKFDYIFFTGSSIIGKIVHQAASKYLTPTTLELGGKNPVYIDDMVDVELATKRLLWGKFINAGQTCIAPDYVLCSRKIQTEILLHAEIILKKWYGNEPKSSPHFGRILTEKQFNRLITFLKCNKIALGGSYDPTDYFVEPTILVDVSFNNPVMQEEIFGPILPIINIENIYTAIDVINNNEKPLAIYVFSKNKQNIDLIINNTSSGGVTINDTLMHAGCDVLPFGGVGNSGMGSYHNKYTFETFVHKKSVLYRTVNRIMEKFQQMIYPPYNETNEKVFTFLMRKNIILSFKLLKYLFTFFSGFMLNYVLLYFKLV